MNQRIQWWKLTGLKYRDEDKDIVLMILVVDGLIATALSIFEIGDPWEKIRTDLTALGHTIELLETQQHEESDETTDPPVP